MEIVQEQTSQVSDSPASPESPSSLAELTAVEQAASHLDTETKCVKCLKTILGKVITLKECSCSYHLECLVAYIEKDFNMCWKCRRPQYNIFEAHQPTSILDATPPRTFSATYVIVDSLMNKLGHRPPHGHEKYHRFRQMLGLMEDQSPPVSFWHAPLADYMFESDRKEFIKKIYENLNVPIIQKINHEKLISLGFDGWGSSPANISNLERITGKKLTMMDIKAMPFEQRLHSLSLIKHHHLLYLAPQGNYLMND